MEIAMEKIDINNNKKKNYDLLPVEITADILSRVPADSILDCKLVCKTWRSLINHPSFVDVHTRHVFLDDDYNSGSMSFFICTYFIRPVNEEFKLHLGEFYNEDEQVIHFKLSEPITHHPYALATDGIRPPFDSVNVISCNGLIFTGSMMSSKDMLYIYNPFTREYVDLLPSYVTFVSSGISSEIYHHKCHIANGFGYNDSTNEYKIVRICYRHESGGLVHASVYTLGSGKWRSKGKILLSMSNRGSDIAFLEGPGMFANGAIYWSIYWLDNHHKDILSFDLGDEKFSLVPEEALQETHYMALRVWRGHLCVISPQYVEEKHSSDIWIAKDKNKVWTRKFNVPWRYDRLLHNELLAISKGGKILLHNNLEGCLYSYDPKTESLSWIENAPALKRFHMIPYTKSFVSLKGLGEEDAKCMDMPTSFGSRTERGESSNGGEGPISVQREDGGVHRGGRGRGRGSPQHFMRPPPIPPAQVLRPPWRVPGRGRGHFGDGGGATTTARFVSGDSGSQHFMRPPPIPPAQVLRPPWRVPGRGRVHFGDGGGAINTTGGNTGRGQMGLIGVGVNRSTWRGRGNGNSNTGRGQRMGFPSVIDPPDATIEGGGQSSTTIGRGQSSTTTARFVLGDSGSQHFMRPPPIPPAQVLRPPWRVPGRGRGHFGDGGGAINTTGGNIGRGQMGLIGVRGNGNINTGRGQIGFSHTTGDIGGGNTGRGNNGGGNLL